MPGLADIDACVCVCCQTNDAYRRASDYEARRSSLKLALSLQAQPLNFYPLLASVHNSHVSLVFSKSLRRIMRSIEVRLEQLMYPGAHVERSTACVSVRAPVKVKSPRLYV